MTLPTSATSRRAGRLLLAALTTVSTFLVAYVAALAPAHANNPPGAHDPIGAVESIVTNSDGSFTVTGWAADPDALSSNATVVSLVDGHQRTPAATSIARPSIARKYGTGPTPGFTQTVQPGTGVHTVCIAVRNIHAGMPHVLRCFVSPRGSYISQSAHSPQGSVTSASATATTMTVQGTVSDPDYLASRLPVVLYVDGQAASTVQSAWTRATDGTRVDSFSFTVPVSAGAHLGCVWVVNVGFGSNSNFGCSAVDTRGRAGSGAVHTPAMNSTVATVAKRQIGKPYVWAAAGPKAFDCSGLVVFSYARAGMTGIYHQSGVQFNKARVIPASRAVPGDLVFYHDNVGNVYHVGIYLSPGKTVAAIDTNQGVNYQTIWDPSSATYGSFTHT